jgi:N-acetyl-anhydromuramyl-L-alanine amidase AmpD
MVRYDGHRSAVPLGGEEPRLASNGRSWRSLVIHDRTADCTDTTHRPRTSRCDGVVIHRFKNEDAHDASSVARFDRMLEAVGRRMAYHFVINRRGIVDQALPLHVVGHHARKWSYSRAGIAVLGDFRRDPPTEKQWAALVTLCCHLKLRHNLEEIDGHTDLPDATSWPNHVCPGPLLDVAKLRKEVLQLSHEE